MDQEKSYTDREHENHKYLCWLDQVRGIGRKTRFSLLRAAAEGNLFSRMESAETGLLIDKRGSDEGSIFFAMENTETGFWIDKRGSDEGSLFSGRKDTKPPALNASENAGLSGVVPVLEKGPDQADSTALPLPSCPEKEEESGKGPGPAASAALLYTMPEAQLRFLCMEIFRTKSRGEKAAGLLLAARKREPERILDDLQRAGIGYASFFGEDYPERLRTIPDPPFGIYWRGGCPGDAEPAAGVIGARMASGYGREQARRFGYQLGRRGITVVSGMARGIDSIAQKAALEAGGRSFAVLGCGVDVCYPEENRDLYDRLLQEGGILSEYPPGTPPEPGLFPPRNRIISGLSDLVLVIEARKKSGTLITVDMALEQGREVYALPGRVSDKLSDGCNRLIRQGAGVATCPEDILEFFFGAEAEENAAKETASVPHGKTEEAEQDVLHRPERQVSPLEAAVLRVLSAEDEMHLDRILEEVGRRIETEGGQPVRLSDLLMVLLSMQMDGRVHEAAAGYYLKGSES